MIYLFIKAEEEKEEKLSIIKKALLAFFLVAPIPVFIYFSYLAFSWFGFSGGVLGSIFEGCLLILYYWWIRLPWFEEEHVYASQFLTKEEKQP